MKRKSYCELTPYEELAEIRKVNNMGMNGLSISQIMSDYKKVLEATTEKVERTLQAERDSETLLYTIYEQGEELMKLVIKWGRR